MNIPEAQEWALRVKAEASVCYLALLVNDAGTHWNIEAEIDHNTIAGVWATGETSSGKADEIREQMIPILESAGVLVLCSLEEWGEYLDRPSREEE